MGPIRGKEPGYARRTRAALRAAETVTTARTFERHHMLRADCRRGESVVVHLRQLKQMLPGAMLSSPGRKHARHAGLWITRSF
jgi:hypothetical protein